MSDKLLAFVAAMRGHSVKSKGGLGGECVDLVEVWAATLGLPPIAGNAKDLLRNADPARWVVVKNGPTNAPAAGDIVVWQQTPQTGPIALGPFGHCAVPVAADSMWILSFDQNWPTGTPAELVMHSYLGVAGWLHPRQKEGGLNVGG